MKKLNRNAISMIAQDALKNNVLRLSGVRYRAAADDVRELHTAPLARIWTNLEPLTEAQKIIRRAYDEHTAYYATANAWTWESALQVFQMECALHALSGNRTLKNAPPVVGELVDVLSSVIAFSVLRKLADPNRKTAVNMEHVSNSGQNPVMLSLLRSLRQDNVNLDKVLFAGARAFSGKYDKYGNYKSVVADADMRDGFNNAAAYVLSDSMDVKHTAAEMLCIAYTKAFDYMGGYLPADDSCGWMEHVMYPYRRLKRSAINLVNNGVKRLEDLSDDDFHFDDLPLITMIYRAVNAYVDGQRKRERIIDRDYAKAFEIETGGIGADAEQTAFYHNGRFAELDGDTVRVFKFTEDRAANLRAVMPWVDWSMYRYESDALLFSQLVYELVKRANLSKTEIETLYACDQYNTTAAAAHLGITANGLHKRRQRIAKRVLECGLTPRIMDESDKLPCYVQQIDAETGVIVGTFSSINAASDTTGINKGSIKQACDPSHRRQSAGGYKWAYMEDHAAKRIADVVPVNVSVVVPSGLVKNNAAHNAAAPLAFESRAKRPALYWYNVPADTLCDDCAYIAYLRTMSAFNGYTANA